VSLPRDRYRQWLVIRWPASRPERMVRRATPSCSATPGACNPTDDPGAGLARDREIAAGLAFPRPILAVRPRLQSILLGPGRCARQRWRFSPGGGGDWRIGMCAGARSLVERAEIATSPGAVGLRLRRRAVRLVHADLRAALLTESNGTRASVCHGHRFRRLRVLVVPVRPRSVGLVLEHPPRAARSITSWLAGYRQSAAVDAADPCRRASLVMLRRLQLQAWASSHAGHQKWSAR